MSHKKALPDDITQFFKGQSVFFQKAKTEDGLADGAAARQQKKQEAPKQQATTVASNHATMPPQNQAFTPSRSPATMLPRDPAAMSPAVVEDIRKTVKQIGKEAATHRFTASEKRQLTEIVYSYERQGYRTSENEITRIAVNWLLQDYQRHGAQSVLAQLLDSLHR